MVLQKTKQPFSTRILKQQITVSITTQELCFCIVHLCYQAHSIVFFELQSFGSQGLIAQTEVFRGFRGLGRCQVFMHFHSFANNSQIGLRKILLMLTGCSLILQWDCGLDLWSTERWLSPQPQSSALDPPPPSLHIPVEEKTAETEPKHCRET